MLLFLFSVGNPVLESSISSPRILDLYLRFNKTSFLVVLQFGELLFEWAEKRKLRYRDMTLKMQCFQCEKLEKQGFILRLNHRKCSTAYVLSCYLLQLIALGVVTDTRQGMYGNVRAGWFKKYIWNPSWPFVGIFPAPAALKDTRMTRTSAISKGTREKIPGVLGNKENWSLWIGEQGNNAKLKGITGTKRNPVPRVQSLLGTRCSRSLRRWQTLFHCQTNKNSPYDKIKAMCLTVWPPRQVIRYTKKDKFKPATTNSWKLTKQRL